MNQYSTCKRCVMDSSAEEFVINDEGICNFCIDFLIKQDNEYNQENFNIVELVSLVKNNGKNKNYDCIVGLSGGVDSSWALIQAVKLGLNPLAVHMDNGWNSQLAQNNIENLVKKLDVDLYTYVIDWDEYVALQKAFFRSNVIDIELLYDNALAKVNYEQAAKYNIKHILSGSNSSTEGMQMPQKWAWRNKLDYLNIRSIFKEFGDGSSIISFPGIGFYYYLYYKIKGITWVPFLNYFDYKKDEALEILKQEYDYIPYPYKHYESVFTRFYQGFILPKKFNVDKRKIHLSNLIITNQLTRDQAIEILSDDPYSNEKNLQEDMDYFLKKFNWTKKQLDDYLAQPQISHDNYRTEYKLFENFTFLYRKLRSIFT